jgi:hypothetical protein
MQWKRPAIGGLFSGLQSGKHPPERQAGNQAACSAAGDAEANK